MDSITAFALGRASRGKEAMVFDWDQAARRIVESGAKRASAGLSGDWEWTGGPIFANGEPTPHEETYTYLASTWATPELSLDGEHEDCYRMACEVPDWGSKTYWPESALKILRGES